jgi:hypothetical protein
VEPITVRPNQISIQKMVVSARIIWGAILASTAVFAVVGQQLKAEGGKPADIMLLVMLGLVAVSGMGISLAPTYIMLPKRLASLRLHVVERVVDPAEERMFRDAAGKQRVFAAPTLARALGCQILMTMTVLSLAGAESVSVLGLVASVLGFPLTHQAPFYALGIVLIAIRFPSQRRWVAAIEGVYNAKLVDRSKHDAEGG